MISMQEIPLLLEPDDLDSLLSSPETASSILIFDLCKPTVYAHAHVPGALHLNYAQIITSNNPVMGLVPDAGTLSNIFSSLGLTPDKHVVAYDDEGGGRAARLLWTLDAIGHRKASLLNGGIHAWIKEEHTYTSNESRSQESNYIATLDTSSDTSPIASREYILENLNNENVMLLDSRSPEEYRGEKKFAARAGRIPGAVNLDWLQVIDKQNNFRLKPEHELKTLLEELGINEEKTIVTYCQTHHRSALTYFMLKFLGFTKIKGYHGSWSDWGNQDDTPVETG